MLVKVNMFIESHEIDQFWAVIDISKIQQTIVCGVKFVASTNKYMKISMTFEKLPEIMSTPAVIFLFIVLVAVSHQPAKQGRYLLRVSS